MCLKGWRSIGPREARGASQPLLTAPLGRPLHSWAWPCFAVLYRIRLLRPQAAAFRVWPRDRSLQRLSPLVLSRTLTQASRARLRLLQHLPPCPYPGPRSWTGRACGATSRSSPPTPSSSACSPSASSSPAPTAASPSPTGPPAPAPARPPRDPARGRPPRGARRDRRHREGMEAAAACCGFAIHPKIIKLRRLPVGMVTWRMVARGRRAGSRGASRGVTEVVRARRELHQRSCGGTRIRAAGLPSQPSDCLSGERNLSGLYFKCLRRFKFKAWQIPQLCLRT